MVPGSRIRLYVHGLALLFLCLGLIMLPPGRSTATVVSVVPQQIDNTQGEFADGEFQRTSIGSSKLTVTPPSNPADVEGLVQLAPAGVLKSWNAPYHLPTPLSEMGMTAVGKHIYVIGGTENITGTGFTDAAWHAQVDPKTGAFVDSGSGMWTNTPMPSAVTIADPAAPTGCKKTTAKRTRAGVVSVTTGTDTGYIYVIGGAVIPDKLGCTIQALSTPLVQRGTVAANGTITWATLSLPTTMGIYVPSPVDPDDGTTDTDNLGVEGASVVIAHTKGSTGEHYYLYVIGGRNVYYDLINKVPKLRALSAVYYTEINIANGSLKHPITGDLSSVWKRDKNILLIPTPAAGEGLWDASATATSVLSGTTALKTAIFLTGGSLDADDTTVNPAVKLNPFIYRADVNPDTGALTWGTGITGSKTQIALGGRRSMASISYHNKLYMIGGRTGDSPSTGVATVPTAFLDDKLDLIKIGNTDYFIGIDTNVLNNGGPAPRLQLGAAVVRAEPPTGVITTTINSAWVYVAGGTNASNTLQDTIFLGSVGGDDSVPTMRTPDGWYYSGVIKTSFAFGSTNLKAKVLSFHWAANIDRTRNTNADIEIQFRKTITASGECPNDGVFSLTSASDAWSSPLDGFASSPLYSQAADATTFYNSATFGTQDLDASCIQYRAHLTQDATGAAAADPSSSPQLLSVYVEKEISGNADINIPTNGFSVTPTADNRITTVMNIQNLNGNNQDLTLSVADVLAASSLGSSYVYGSGNFFVLFCKAYSSLTDPNLPNLTLPDPLLVLPPNYEKTCPAYASILNSEMGKGSIIDLLQSKNSGGESRWYDTSTLKPISAITDLINTSGHYQIGLVIDQGNNVPEGEVTSAGELNNRSEILTFTLNTDPLYLVMLPVVTR